MPFRDPATTYRHRLNMKLLLLADGIVGNVITSWLVGTHKKDLAMVVVKEDGYAMKSCRRGGVPCVLERDWDRCGKYDLGILAWWPDVIPPWWFDLCKHGFVNTHPSLLPWGRGRNPNFWALVNGTPFGVSLHKVEKTVDSGAIIAQKKIPYGWTDTGESIYLRAQHEMFELFKKTYPKLRTLKFKAKKQPKKVGEYHSGFELEGASHIFLNNSYIAKDLINLMRARTFTDKPGAWFIGEDGKKYEINIEIRRVYGRKRSGVLRKDVKG